MTDLETHWRLIISEDEVPSFQPLEQCSNILMSKVVLGS